MKTWTPLLFAVALTGCDGAEEAFDTALLGLDTGASARVAPAPATPVIQQPVVVQRPVELGNESVLTVSHDAGADGVIDRRTRTTFDGNGDRLMIEEDRDGDGIFEDVKTFTHFYEGDRLVRIETDSNADGVVDEIEQRSWTERGQPLLIIKDTDADGQPDRIEENVYDEDWRRVQWRVDAPVGGELETVQDFHFVNGRQVGRTLTRTMGDQPLNSTEYENTYRPDGKLDAMLVDLEGDGVYDNRITRLYDANGRYAGSETDTGNDGTIDNRSTQTYDDDGRLVLLTIDIGADGTPDTLIHRDYVGFERRAERCLTR